MMFIPACTTNAMTSDFLSSITPGNNVPRLQSYGLYIFQLVRFASTSVLDCHSKNL